MHLECAHYLPMPSVGQDPSVMACLSSAVCPPHLLLAAVAMDKAVAFEPAVVAAAPGLPPGSETAEEWGAQIDRRG